MEETMTKTMISLEGIEKTEDPVLLEETQVALAEMDPAEMDGQTVVLQMVPVEEAEAPEDMVVVPEDMVVVPEEERLEEVRGAKEVTLAEETPTLLTATIHPLSRWT